MAPGFRAILAAVALAANRGSKSLRQVSGNNMFHAGVTLLFMLDPAALALFGILMAIVLFLPSSNDPMTVIPPERLALWPLTPWERRALRLLSPLLNPLTWLLLAGLLWKRVAWSLWTFVAAFFLVGFFGSSLRFPSPRIAFFSPLVSKDLRQFLTALDLYCALLLSIPAAWLRFTGELPRDAQAPLTMVILIILSTMALTLFGLDGESGIARYRLMPLPGWRILLAKGFAYLLLVVLATAPLSPAAGLGGGLAALAVGQWCSVRQAIPQMRWRFRATSPFSHSLLQMLAALAGFGVVSQLGLPWLGVCFGVYGISLWLSGRRLDS